MTNSGRASTLAATDAATPTLRRIERAAIAAATPITYHSRFLSSLKFYHSGFSYSGATSSPPFWENSSLIANDFRVMFSCAGNFCF